ncbi:MAG: AMP-binding protein [Lachnospiraceae bacterium]|nr:AMP-binding protein [Lachnospiraceae bacterium]
MLSDKIRQCFDLDKIAVVDEYGMHSYKELGIQVKHFQNFFEVNSARKVMIQLRQGFDAYSIILAAYLAGTEYCPIDVECPKDRIEYCKGVYNPDLVIVDEKLIDTWFSENVYCVSQILEKDDATLIRKTKECNSNAYTIFTSGSTGVPKGVSVSRHALENFVNFGNKEYHIDIADVCSQFSNLTFDLSVFDIFMALSNGAMLVAFPSMFSRMIPDVLIEKYKITYWHSVPNVIHFFMKKENIDLSSIRIFNFAGEAFGSAEAKFLFDKNRKCKIYNVFGHTETTFCMYQKLEYDTFLDFCDNTVSIGKTIPGYEVALKNVDDDGIGEIVIIGDEIAEGYLSEDEKKAFNKIQIANREYRYFVSGDYGYLKNGNMYFWGRKDDQCKIAGYRIDTNEIDKACMELGMVSCTISLEKKLYTFLLGTFSDEEMLMAKKALSSKLESYKVPSKIISIKEFPYNTNNKIDKKVLRELITESM